MQQKVNPVDLIGRKFGRLTVMAFSHRNKNGPHMVCRCDCGNEKILITYNFVRDHGGTRSCGCLQKEITKSLLTTHGLTKTPLWRVWVLMRQRCYYPKDNRYSRYGGRGITVCDKWMTFEGFREDMERGYSKGLSIERIDNDGNYEPGNCKWATKTEQVRNRSTTLHATFNGATKTVFEWSLEIGIKYQTLRKRLCDGWSIEKALTTPTRISSRIYA